LRREAETRQREEARRWSRSDTTAATRFLEEGKTQEGLAHLVHAARIDPENPVVASRLLSTLTTRSFAQPVGSTVQLPAGPFRDSDFGMSLNSTLDGRLVAYYGEDQVLRLVNVENGRVEREFKRAAGFNRHSLWGNLVYTGATDRNTAEHYDAATGKRLSRLENVRGWSYGIMSADGSWLGLSYEKAIRVWDTRTGKLRANLLTEVPADRMHFSPDGSRVAVLYDNYNFARVWSVSDAKPLGQPLAPSRSGTIGSVAIDHSGRSLPCCKMGRSSCTTLPRGSRLGPCSCMKACRAARLSRCFRPMTPCS
jgi:WD40 repeat protein